MAQALDDVVVLDLSQHIAGPYATKLLADYGADVIKVEPPGGDIARQLGPFQNDDQHPEKSGLFFYLNTNKRSAVIDLRTAEGKDALAALASRAHIVVEAFSPGTLDRLGVGWDWLQQVNPKASMISVSNFGQDGPYRDYRLSELVLYGFAGEMYSMGLTEREPVKMAGTAALFESGSAVAAGAMGALWAGKRHGIHQRVDIALAETHFGGVDRRHATAIAYQFSGRKMLRAGSATLGMPQGIYPCADGYMEFNNAGLRYDRIQDMLGYPDWATDERFTDPMARFDPTLIEEWNAYFLEWCVMRTKKEVWAEARRAKVLCGPLFTMEDLFEDEHFTDRGFWAHAEHPVLGNVRFHGRPFMMEKGGWELRRPAPLLGQHTEEVLREAGATDETITAVGRQQKQEVAR